MLNASGSRPQSSNRVPYAPPGVARPPRQQTSGGGGGIGGSKSSSHRSRARDRWSQLFQGPAYLEPGASNRLVLSLRSCVASEVDFSLERLIQVSSIDPELLRFNELPGLFDGLLNLIKDYLDLTTTSTSLMMNNSETRQVSRKRASEASLILRNLSLEGKKNLEVFIQSKKFKKLLIQVLEQGEIEGFLGEETTEIRLYLLEVLELIGEHIPLVIPGHSIPLSSDEEEENSNTSQSTSKPEPLDSPSVKLFPLLVNLTTSPDRALVLASFRCLTVLSLNEKSDHLFSILTYLNLPPLPKTQPHPIETSLKLLTLGDSELTTVLLDFIYQHTLLPSNSVLFSSRNDLVSILKLICSKFELGARIEQVETLVLESSSEAASFFKSNFGDQIYNKQDQDQDQRMEEDNTSTQDGLLSMREVREIINTSEPERTISWMHKMYEIDPDSDITQVSLWTAYKTQFEPLTTTNNDEPSSSSNVPVMLQAQDVIKLAGQTFPSVVPTIVEDPEGRKFIIKGLKLKEKKNTTTVVPGECGWKGCQNSKGHENVLEFHQHVYNSHLLSPSSSSSPPTTCLWSNCTYTTSSDDDPSLQLARISLHTRTHLPSLSNSRPDNNQTQSVVSSSELPISKLHHVRYHAQVDEHHEATGPSFLTCLILRNLSRTAKLAKEALQPQSSTTSSDPSSEVSGGGRISVASGNAAIGRLAEGEQSIFEAFALAEESASGGSFSGGGGSGMNSRKNGILQKVEKPDWKLAEPIIKALESVEDRILKMALSNVVLGKYLVEVVGTIEGFKKDEMRKNLEEGGEGGEEEQVKMEE